MAQGHNFYPRSPCGERPPSHSPYLRNKNFYPRSPCGERLSMTPSMGAIQISFLSTLSLRRATIVCNSCSVGFFDFYPRSPCGERRAGFQRQAVVPAISIHALLAESDRQFPCQSPEKSGFLSTLSLRRATLGYVRGCFFCVISIHALLAESDISCALSASKLGDFYPRSPCGERRQVVSTKL